MYFKERNKWNLVKKKTHEEYVKELAENNPNLEVIERYRGSQTKILHRCKKHGISWETMPCNALKGSGCNLCKIEKIKMNERISNEEYIRRLNKINPHIVSLQKYEGANVKILHKCLIHNYEWLATPNNFMYRECGCPKCKREKIYQLCAKSQKEYEKEVTLANPLVSVVGTYVNSSTPILHKCKVHGTMWLASPISVLKGSGCPLCHSSLGERKIADILINLGIEFEAEKRFEGCTDIHKLPFDFFLPAYNACIEYDGQHHFYPVNFGGINDTKAQMVYDRTTKHDIIKAEFCKKNKISLYRIKYDQNIDEKLNEIIHEIQQ